MKGLRKYLTRTFPSVASNGQLGSFDFILWLGQTSGAPFFGLKKESKKLFLFRILYCLFLTVPFGVIYTLLELYDVTLVWRDVNGLTQNASLMLTHLSGLIKVTYILKHVSDIQMIIGKLRQAVQRFVVNENQNNLFLKGEIENKIFVIFYASAVLSGCAATLVVLQLNPQLVEERQFPCRVTLPHFLPQSIKRLYIPLSIMVMGYQIVSVDLLIVILINLVRTNLSILCAKFEEIDELFSTAPAENLHEIVHERLRNIIQYHYELLDIRNRIERFIRLPMLLQFFSSLVIFAMTGFQMISGTSNQQGGTVIIVYIYCLCLILQLFFSCCIGTMVSTKSIEVAQYVGTCAWYTYDERCKKSVYLFLITIQKPFIFTAGGVIELSLPTFLGILKMSYTYVAVLQSFYN